MTLKKTTSRKYLQSIKLIYFLFVLLPTLILACAIYLYMHGFSLENTTRNNYIFIGIAVFITVLSITQGIYIYRKILNKIKSSPNLLEKLYVFRSALIIRYTLIEGACLLSAIAFMYSGNIIALALAAAVCIYFISLFPTAHKIMAHLDLNEQERILLNDPKAIL